MSAVVASHVKESAVIPVPAEDVWKAIKTLDFSWWKLVASSVLKEGSAPLSLGANYVVTFKDGQKWTVALTEASELSRSITFEIVESEPALNVTSVVHTISVHKVTQSNTAFVQWDSDFSNDASSEVLLDSKFKKLEAFNDLAGFFA